MSLRVVPVLFLPDSNNPVDPHLHDAVQAYCEREFGYKLKLSNAIKTWAVVSEDDSGYVVHGLTSVRYSLDCPTFHVTPGTDDASEEKARTVRDLLFARAYAFLQDGFGPGSVVTVHVAP